jgi:hypothetical protein
MSTELKSISLETNRINEKKDVLQSLKTASFGSAPRFPLRRS